MKTINRTLVLILCLILLTGNYANCQDIKVPEPEFVNSVIYVSGNKVQKLEKAKPMDVSGRTTASYVTGYYASESSKQVSGTSSPVRLPADKTYSFIVRLYSNDTDPFEVIAIIKMQKTKYNRKYRESSYNMLGQTKSGDLEYISFEGKKYGKSSYLIQTTEPLAPGEYAIQLRNSNDILNCFGVGELNATTTTTTSNTTATNNKTATGSAKAATTSNQSGAAKTATTEAPKQVRTDYTRDESVSERTEGEIALPAKGNIYVNGGFGLGSTLYDGVSVFFAGEFMITDLVGLGLEYDRLSYTEDYYSGSYKMVISTFGPRGTFHFSRLLHMNTEKFDLYGGLFIGYAKAKAEAPSGYSVSETSPLGYGLFAGARFNFSSRFSLLGELGYGVNTLKVGMTFRIK